MIEIEKVTYQKKEEEAKATVIYNNVGFFFHLFMTYKLYFSYTTTFI